MHPDLRSVVESKIQDVKHIIENPNVLEIRSFHISGFFEKFETAAPIRPGNIEVGTRAGSKPTLSRREKELIATINSLDFVGQI